MGKVAIENARAETKGLLVMYLNRTDSVRNVNSTISTWILG